MLIDNCRVCLLRFEDEKLPGVYIIPAKAWRKPNYFLKDRACPALNEAIRVLIKKEKINYQEYIGGG